MAGSDGLAMDKEEMPQRRSHCSSSDDTVLDY